MNLWDFLDRHEFGGPLFLLSLAVIVGVCGDSVLCSWAQAFTTKWSHCPPCECDQEVIETDKSEAQSASEAERSRGTT